MSFLGGIKARLSGAKTFKLYELTNPCPACNSLGCHMDLHVDAHGHREMMTFECPKCGPVKKLYTRPPEPRFEAVFTEAVLGEKKQRPKRYREV